MLYFGYVFELIRTSSGWWAPGPGFFVLSPGTNRRANIEYFGDWNLYWFCSITKYLKILLKQMLLELSYLYQGSTGRDVDVLRRPDLYYLAGPGVLAKSWSNDPILRLDVILWAFDAWAEGILGPINEGSWYELAAGYASHLLYLVRLPIEYFEEFFSPENIVLNFEKSRSVTEVYLGIILPCGWHLWFSYRPGPGVLNASCSFLRPNWVYFAVPSLPNRVISSLIK